MKKALLAAVAAVGLGLLMTASASAQTVRVDPGTGQTYVQYYTPYTYGSTAYYYYPNTGYTYSYGIPAATTYSPPRIYGPGYMLNTPYAYNSYYYGTYGNYGGYYGNPTYYRTYRWWR
jgi:hypothetical protein